MLIVLQKQEKKSDNLNNLKIKVELVKYEHAHPLNTICNL